MLILLKPSQFSAPPKTSFAQFPVQQQQQQQQQIQPQFEQPKNVVVAPKPAPQQQQQQLQQPKSISSISLAEKINEFAKQINELKSSAAKLFDGKELAANLLDYSVIKKSKQVREKYLKINEEMQVSNSIIELLHFHPAVLKCKLNIIYLFILPDENPRKSMKKICSIKIKINL